MLKPERTPRFKREFKRLKKKHYPMNLLKEAIVALLVQNSTLLLKLDDHSLKGQWQGYRELHPARLSSSKIRHQLDGWVLIYKISNDHLTLVLVATGDHEILKKK